MTTQTSPVQWAIDTLTASNVSILSAHESVRETPWSKVSRILTSDGYVYLKQMAPQFAYEPFILKWLYQELAVSVPKVIAHEINNRWFLMNDAGQRLRESLKATYQTEWVAHILKQYANIQKNTLHKQAKIFCLGVKDWRLEHLPTLYQQLLSQTDFLIKDGLTMAELVELKRLQTVFKKTCRRLAKFQLPETIEHGDFQDNNILIDKDNNITFNDWGDANITHPFFSLGSWLDSASRHHQMGADDPRRGMLIKAYLEEWQSFADIKMLYEAFDVSERIRPVLFATNFFRVASCPGMEELGQFKGYIADALKQFMAKMTCTN